MHINSLLNITRYILNNLSYKTPTEEQKFLNSFFKNEFKNDRKNKNNFKDFYELIGKINKKNKKLLTSVPEMPDLTGKDLRERKILSEHARNDVLEYITNKLSFGSIINRLYYTSEDDYKNKNNELDRATQCIVIPNLIDKNEEQIRNEVDTLVNSSPDQKNNYINNKIDSFLKLITDITEAKTDEDFMKVVNGKTDMLYQLIELQKNKNTISGLERFIGKPLDDKTKEKLEKVQNSAVSIGGLAIDRLQLISNPIYGFTHNKEEMNTITNWMKNNMDVIEGSVETIPEANELMERFMLDTSTKCQNRSNVYGNTFSIFAELYQSIPDRIKEVDMPYIQDLLGVEAEKLGTNLTYQDREGNEIDLIKASELLYERQDVRIFDKDGHYIDNIKVIDDYLTISKIQDHTKDLNFNNLTKDSFKKYLENFKKELDDNNPWYMRFRSFFKKNDYSKVIDKINSMMNLEDLSKDNVLKEMSELQRLCNNYLQGKQGNKSNSDLEKNRINSIINNLNMSQGLVDSNERETLKRIKEEQERTKEIDKKVQEKSKDIEAKMDVRMSEMEARANTKALITKCFKEENPDITVDEIKEKHKLISKQFDMLDFSKPINKLEINNIAQLANEKYELEQLMFKVDPTLKNNMQKVYDTIREVGDDYRAIEDEINTLTKVINHEPIIVDNEIFTIEEKPVEYNHKINKEDKKIDKLNINQEYIENDKQLEEEKNKEKEVEELEV